MNTVFKVFIPSHFLFQSFYDTDYCTMMGQICRVSYYLYTRVNGRLDPYTDPFSAGKSIKDLTPFLIMKRLFFLQLLAPRMKRARSFRNISYGVTHLISRPMQTLGILIFLVDGEAISWVTIVCLCAIAKVTK
jgi:hypothetical protein